MVKIDWNKAKTEYVTNSNLTLESIAEKYGASREFVWRRSAEEGWTKERRKHEVNVYEQTIEKLARDAVRHRVDVINTGLFLVGKSIRNIKEKDFNPTSFKEAVDAIYKAAKIINDMLPISEIQPPQNEDDDTPEAIKDWYIRIAKEFAPEVLKEVEIEGRRSLSSESDPPQK